MNDESPDITDQRMSAHLEYFAERANLLFCYHFFIIEYLGDDDVEGEPSENPRTWRIKSIQNACLHTSLIALRDLDDFFTPRTIRTNADDLRASDFGLSFSMQFLADDERRWINKLIAHTTQHGAVQRGYSWDMHELISKGVAQCDTFLERIKEDYSVAHFNMWTAAAGTQSIIRSIMESIMDQIGRKSEEDTELATT